MKKISLFLIIFIIIIFLVNSNVFAFTIEYNGNTYELPNLPQFNGENYYIHYVPSGNYFVYYLDILNDNGSVSFNEDGNSLSIQNIYRYQYRTKYPDNGWTVIGDITNSVAGNPNIIFSTFNIYYTGTNNIYFQGESGGNENDNTYGIDTLYIGDIPLSFEYAQFYPNYVDLFSQSSANNEDLIYYRIYFIDNAFYYSTGTMHFDNNVNFQKINVTNNFFYRRDFVNICLNTFIIIIFFLWVTNLFTSIIYKGGILRGLF